MIEFDFGVIAAALASGAAVGFLLALFGGGGSVLAAPLLIYFVGVSDPHIAIGTSAAAVAINAVVSLVGHWREHKVKWPCASTFALMGLLGSVAGSTVALATVLSMLRRPKFEGDPGVHITPKIVARLAPMGLITGFAAGFWIPSFSRMVPKMLISGPF